MDKKELINAFHKSLSPLGFIRKLSTWYLADEELIKVVNLQRFNFGLQYYVNIGIYFKTLGNEQYPKMEVCHINLRMHNDLPGHGHIYDDMFDLDKISIDEEQLIQVSQDFVHHFIVPQLELIKTKDGLLSIAKSTPAILNMIPLKTKEYLGIPR